ncbi:Golgi transport complex subunit 5-domain-containing protein [Rhodofomes roseus]|uniref:Conserved oligomeric Golgi complex subunit 5 n=1 Tax=Rhodofomes roseus TaxID=34475 RepID=A0ABQ8K5P6_9APHY|nr:Golgi transport complex subunit 5-domain-containing protein [Rhodofomes roseus]KAH9832285.1 Golgi transport complex subunit 5-domain-containing protein [Rhodofomes roseus]
MSDYAVFAQPEFEPNEYANAILAGEPYPPQTGKSKSAKAATFEPANEDISVAIQKLNFSIDDVDKQLKNVTTHHEDLLVQAAGVTELEGSLTSVRNGLDELDTSFEKLRTKVRVPYQSLQVNVTKLERIQQANDILRRMSRFVILTRRLELQLAEMNKGEGLEAETPKVKQEVNGSPRPAEGSSSDPAHALAELEDEKERVISKAALTVAELNSLLDNAPPENSEGQTASEEHKVPLSSIKTVAAHLPYIESARTRITADMENMIMTGLAELNHSLIASSLQTAHNLRVLPLLVQQLVSDLSETVEGRIKFAFDMSRISKEVLAKEPQSASHGLMYKSRVRTEPTNVTAPQYSAALWTSLEGLVEEMASCCVKVYALENVLKLKKDPMTQVIFLDEAMKTLESKPSTFFWNAIGRSLEKQAKDAAKGSSFLQQTLSSGYPRLLRLFHSFFAKIAVQTDTIYTQTHQSPETVIVLRALSNFESLYLSRSSNRLNEAVGQAFAGGPRSPPGLSEGINIARVAANELDSAKFDPLLVRSVAQHVASALEMLTSRGDGMVIRERSATTLIGPSATPSQVLNGQLATCLHACWSRLEKLQVEYPEGVLTYIRNSIASLNRAVERIVDPLLGAVRRELGAIIARLHRMDFSDAVDPMSAMGGGPSPYMKDLVEKMSFIRTEVLVQYNVPERIREWIIGIVKYVIKTFVLHASIAKPLGESGKLQLTSDMTELEFGLSAFMSDKTQQGKRGTDWESVGDDYRALRAMRQLLFLDNAQLASPGHTMGLPPLLVLHHILVRSPIALPHTLHGWAEAEYVRWVNEHSEEEAWTLVEGDLTHWEKIAEAEGKDSPEANEYVQLARTVLANAMKKP